MAGEVADETNVATTRHRWWWVVIPCLVIIYVLGMAPLNAAILKRPRVSNVIRLLPNWAFQLNRPLFWAGRQSAKVGYALTLYQGWWSERMNATSMCYESHHDYRARIGQIER
jgi:hypothetical protein